MCRTAVNMTGDLTAALIMDRLVAIRATAEDQRVAGVARERERRG